MEVVDTCETCLVQNSLSSAIGFAVAVRLVSLPQVALESGAALLEPTTHKATHAFVLQVESQVVVAHFFFTTCY